MRTRSTIGAIIGALLLIGAGCAPASRPSADAVPVPEVQPVSPAQAAPPPHDDSIPGRYIVVFKDNVDDPDGAADDLAGKHGLGVDHKFGHLIKGFSATVPDAKLAALKADPRVDFVSQDHAVTAYATRPAPAPQTAPTGVRRVKANTNANKGAGVGVAVIDTGIDLTHPDLAANIVANVSCIAGKKTGQDDNGHGTHVAGTIAAIDNAIGVVGVAPQAKLAAVKVLNNQGSGSWSSVICGLDWATANAAKYNLKVVSMSLGGSGTSDNNCGKTNNDALHKSICRARDAGLTVVVAAGNSTADAATSVPAAYDDAVITVSALNDSDGLPGGSGPATTYGQDDTFATFSNFGSVVDLGAPGVNILSTWLGGGYTTLSGTSMATPHVSGAAALYIADHPGSTWTQVRDALKSAGEAKGAGHTDPSNKHPEPVLQAGAL